MKATPTTPLASKAQFETHADVFVAITVMSRGAFAGIVAEIVAILAQMNNCYVMAFANRKKWIRGGLWRASFAGVVCTAEI